MAEVKALEMVVGSTRRVRITGRTKRGQLAALESVVATVMQNPEAFSVEAEPEDHDGNRLLTIRCTGLGAGLLSVDADGRVGDGVVELRTLLPLSGLPADAAEIVFEDEGEVDEGGPAVEAAAPGTEDGASGAGGEAGAQGSQEGGGEQ